MLGEETKEQIDREVQGWIFNMEQNEFEDALDRLELTKNGTIIVRQERLLRRIAGDYSENDFEATDGEEVASARTRREEKLLMYLENTRICEGAKRKILEKIESRARNEISGSTTEHETSSARANEVGASSTLNETEVQGDLIQLRDEISEMQPATLSTITTTTMTTTTTTATGIQTHNSQQFRSSERRVRISHPTGKEIEVPEWLAIEIATTQSLSAAREREIQRLKQQVTVLANSTRINEAVPANDEPRAARNVNFQDTFDLRYLENNNGINEEMQRVQRSRLNANAPEYAVNAANPPVTSELSEFGGRGNRQFAPHNQDSWQTVDRSAIAPRQVDIGYVVRQWRIKFTGEKGASIEEFIQRVEECRRLAHISDEDLLNSLTELFGGVALHWCRRSRSRWRNWNDFCTAARRCWGVDRRFQQRLILEAQNRTQGKEEPVRDYIICLLTIMSRFEEPWAPEMQLDLLHRNMLPELQRLVRISKCRDVDELLELARDAEAQLEAERSYKPPPSPEQSLLPEVAYKSQQKKSTAKTSVAAVSASTPVNDEVTALKQMNEQLMEQVKQLLKQCAATAETPQKNVTAKQGDSSTKSTTDAKQGEKKSFKNTKSRSRKPKSDKNKGKEPGPRAYAECWDCSWPGYIRSTCPECSGKAKGSE